jgi:leucyl aminopeptidase
MPLPVSSTSGPLESVECDFLGLAVCDPPTLGEAAGTLDSRLAGRIAHLIEDKEIKGASGTLTLVHTLGELAAHRVAVAGLGKPAAMTADAVRTAASRLADRACRLGGGSVAWALDPSLALSMAEQARAVVDGLVLGAYEPGRWKTKPDERGEISQLVLCGADEKTVGVARRAEIAARWANECRQLVDTPGNELNPVALADRAGSIASQVGLRIETLDRAGIEQVGMGAFVAVAQGSDAEPRLIVLDYAPDGAPAAPVLGLVGKAITFDTGGISIKPSSRMEDMKGDMAGGAATLCGIAAIAELGIPLRVMAVIPSAENMPSGRAVRPGDIVTSLNGKTIEITNTDAEGRLVLADALTHARRRGATHLIDLATLTGAVVVALGDFYAGLMGNDDEWVQEIREAGDASGDYAWPLPLHDTYKRHYRSTFADMKNSSDLRQAGPIYAGRFLQEFAGDGPFAHLDIAGTGSLDRSREDYYTRKGGTGYGVRLIAELAGRLAAASSV